MSGVRRKMATWGAFSLGLLLACSACGYLVRVVVPRPPKYSRYPSASVAPPAPVARADLVSRPAPAFGPATTPTPKDAAEFAPLFDALAAATRTGDTEGYAALWDCDRTADEVWSQVASWTRIPPANHQVHATALEVQRTVANRGRDPGRAFRADRTEVLTVARSRDGREARVVARHTVAEDGVSTVYGVRWWLVRIPGGAWRVYDRDVPGSRLRASFRLAGHEWQNRVGAFGPGAAASEPPPGDGLPQTPIGAVEEALELPLDGSTFELELALDACRGANLPPPWVAARAVAEANLHLQEGEPRKALTVLDAAARLDPTFPLTHLVRGVAANRLGDHKAALRHLTEYRNLVGPDAEAALHIGIAQEGLKRPAEALATFRAAVKDFPGHSPLYPALARTLPAGQKREAGERAAKGPKPADHLGAILSAPEAGDVALADEVAAGFLAVKPGDPHGLTAAAVVRVRQGKGPEAAALLRQAREVTPGEKHDEMREVFYGAVLRYGVPVAGYQATPPTDRSALFRRMAHVLDSTQGGPLLELVAAHRAAAPSDPWGDYWMAHLLAEGGRLEQAEELLAATMARLPKPTSTNRKTLPRQRRSLDFTDDEATWDDFRSSRVYYLFKLGRWRDAYRELPPAVDTFGQLATLLSGTDDVAGLAQLVETHRKVVPMTQRRSTGRERFTEAE